MTVKDRELKRNASGYYDETAYKAILNAQKGEHNMNIKPGDIYEFWGKNDKKITALILAVNENTSIMLQLHDYKNHNDIEVLSKSIMYTNPEMLQYVFNDNLTNYIKTVTDEQYKSVMKEVKKVIGFDNAHDSSSAEENEALKNKIKNLENKIKEQEFEVKQKIECAHTLNENMNDNLHEISVLKTERDLYKDLYEKILTKLLSA